MKWTRGPIIGHGSSAAVSIATSNNSGEILAVKSSDLQHSEPLQHEQRILSSLNCPHIVTYRGRDITRERSKLVYNLFLEYLPRGTLVDEIRRNGGKLDEPTIIHYSRQIVGGLDYLHSRGLVHCDIKGRNILIGEDGAKIADFGCAKSADEVGSSCGTPAFMAPEVARGEGQGAPSDVWAFGCTVIQMATGKPPWEDEAGGPLSVLYRIGFSDWSTDIPGNLSGQARDFLERCLRRNPEDRWTASQLLNHPFLADTGCSSSTRGTESPTSILEIGLWSSVDTESEISRSSSWYSESLGAGEPVANRIEQLAGPLGRVPDWRWDEENWIRVRKICGGVGRDHDDHNRIVGSGDETGIGSVGKNQKLDTLGENILGLGPFEEDFSVGLFRESSYRCTSQF